MCATFPQAMYCNYCKHILSLSFLDLLKVKKIQVSTCCILIDSNHYLTYFISNTCVEVSYDISGSGASHGIHAQFMAQAAAFNDGEKIVLLWFYSMH